MNHTKEPWYAVGAWVENPNDDAPDICNCDPAAMAQAHFDQSYEVTCANARRIVACVNACAGIETHELELMTGRMSIASQIKACDAIYATAEAKATRRSKFARQRDELLAAAEAIEINAEECMDFDDCTAMLVPIDDYHKLMDAIATAKGATP